MQPENKLVLDNKNISLKDIIDVAINYKQVEISTDKKFIEVINRSQKHLHTALQNEIPVYGVTTGFGKSCDKRMAVEVATKNGRNLLRFHGCGTGEPIGVEETRAAMMCRIVSHSKGYSGVSIDLLKQMADFLNNGITPVVPCEGSVGASGDLTPMSYIASALAGEREVFYKGKRIPAMEAIKAAGLKPYEFAPKEPLAMINGTTTMTGIAVIVAYKSRRLLNAGIFASALSSHSIKGNMHHFHPSISEAKPYRGQKFVAAKILNLLETESCISELEANELETLQDPYSIRCTPQILGVLYDALEWIEEWVTIEVNSANDNPLLDPKSGEVLMGGNFYGGHIAFAMDSLKAAIASLSDLFDRQMALLVNPNVNRGLPADLVRMQGEERLYHHGFKAMSISTSALTAEALKLTMPAASFSRSTESNNQDKVSMGTIAARDAGRILQLTARVLAILLMASVQACELRNNFEQRKNLSDIIKSVRKKIGPTIEDRPMDKDIETLTDVILNSQMFSL